MRYNPILFDLDGTLCDPGPGIVDSVQFALKSLGIVETDKDKLRSFVGPPLHHTFNRVYSMDEATTHKAVRLYRERFQAEGIHEYRAYPGVIALLERLKENGAQLAVATSKIESFAKQILKATAMIDYFGYVVGTDPHNPQPKAATISEALQHFHRAGISITSAIMVGDKEHDIIGANENFIDSVGVLFGYGTQQELEASGATHIVNSVAALTGLLLS